VRNTRRFCGQSLRRALSRCVLKLTPRWETADTGTRRWRWSGRATALVLVGLLSPCLCAQVVPNQVRAMKLVAPKIGWALMQQHLYWTSDDGQKWTDITPPGGAGQRIDGVFFLDTTHGWAMLSAPSPHGAPGIFLKIASTGNGGKTWADFPMDMSIDKRLRIYAGGASIFFADRVHGWLILRLMSSSNFSVGILLATEDGGRTWAKLPDPPAADPVRFITLEEGWMAGGPAFDQLWFTPDGGRSWQRRAIPVPARCPKCRVIYTTPHFENARQAVMPVTILQPDRSFVGTYITHDGGRSWMAAELYESRATHLASTSVFDSHVIRASIGQKGEVKLRVDKMGFTSSGLPQGLWPMGAITKADFANDRSGWLLYSAGRCLGFKSNCSQQVQLLSTEDGGRTFRIIAPRHPAGATSQRSSPDRAQGARPTGPLPSSVLRLLAPGTLTRAQIAEVVSISNQATDPTGSRVSNEQNSAGGFDRCVAPTVSHMGTWWSYSPYYDVGIYVGGDEATCPPNTPSNPNLDASWVSQVSGMGWGLMPLWVGPQMSELDCGGLQSWKYVISLDPSTAYSQGLSEGVSALSAANSLGVTSSVIYYDMEPYVHDGSTCSNAAINFVEGWVEELHAGGFTAGLYTISTYYYQDASDFASASPVPDAVWPANYGVNHSVLNIPYLSNSYWATSQRIHQYCSDISSDPQNCSTSEDGLGESFGGVDFISQGGIDGDAEDAPVVSWSGDRNLPPPTLLYPPNTSGSVSLTPTFSWSAVTGASSGYRIMVATDPSFLPSDPTSPNFVGCSYPSSGCPINDTPTGTSDTAAAGALQAGVTYYWEVHARGEKYGDWSSEFSFTTGGASTLSVTLAASPSSGTAPLSTTLSASVTGSATGTINYTFWYNCTDTGTNVSSEMTICGTIPTPTAGTCASNTIGEKCDGVTDNPKAIAAVYSSAGSYTAKVIAERGSAQPAQSQAPVTVNALTTGTIQVNATLNGSPWPTSGTGSLAFNLSGPSGLSGSVVPVTYTSMVAGSYILSYASGGPGSATLSNITPSSTQPLSGGGAITFTLNFSSIATTYTISGQVTLNSAGLSGVTITLSGSSSSSTTTDTSGNFSFAGLASGGNYTVTPTFTGYTFSPGSSSFNSLSTNQTANFAAVPKKRKGQVISE